MIPLRVHLPYQDKVQPEQKIVWSPDNVRLHWLSMGDRNDRPTLLCLPGLTRNSRDFLPLAERLAPHFHMVLPSFRGRGESGQARDPLTYEPLTYVRDMALIVEAERLDSFIVIGTSLGALVGLLMGLSHGERIRGILLNDAGPQLEMAGLERILGQLGRGGNWKSWLQAARDLSERQGMIYPGWELEDWIAHAKRLCRLTPEGRIVWDYDPQIAVPLGLAPATGPSDLWAALRKFADRPLLSVRGELSDLFLAETQRKMLALSQLWDGVAISNVGHAPTLWEPEAQMAIEFWFERRFGISVTSESVAG